MTMMRFGRTYCLTEQGRTVGIGEGGPFEITGDIAPWIQFVTASGPIVQDITDLIVDLEPARAEHVRRVVKALHAVAAACPVLPSGRVTLVGDVAVLEEVTALSGTSLPDVSLGLGALDGDWFDDLAQLPPSVTVGVVVLVEDAALVVGPAAAGEIVGAIESLRLTGLPPGRPDPDTVAIAAAQLVRRAIEPPRGAWSGQCVQAGETSTWRLRPHPRAVASAPSEQGDFDQRIMAVVDPRFGTILDVAEGDLPQVPRQMSAVHLAGRGWRHPMPVTVHADGSSFEDARRRAVLAALACHAERCIDPRRVASPEPTTDEALGMLGVPARRLADGLASEIPLRKAFDLGTGAGNNGIAACDEDRDRALTSALLAAAEQALADPGTPLVRAQDDEGQGVSFREAVVLMRQSDPSAWWGWYDGVIPPTAVAVTGRGSVTACGSDLSDAARSAMTRAVLAEQVLSSGRADLLPSGWRAKRPDAAATAAAPTHPRLTVRELERAIAVHHPDAVVVDLDHDRDLTRLGLIVVKVVTAP